VKIIIRLIAVVAIIGVLIGAGFWMHGGSSRGPELSAVRVEKAGRGDLIEVVQAPAEVQPKNKVSISARISARIVDLPVKEGDKVKAGDVLVKLDSTDLEAALRSAKARYAAQQAGIEVNASRLEGQRAQILGLRAALLEAERDFERQKGLVASHDVSQSVLETAERHLQESQSTLDSALYSLKADETNLEVLRHNLEAADADIAKAKEDLSYTTIMSPIDGVITVINAKTGELVMTGTMNNAGTVILEVADLSEMTALARVDETDVANVEVGQKAKVHLLAFPDETFEGTVTAVALARSTERISGGSGSNSDSKTFKVELLLDTRSKRVHSGLTADVEIETRKNENVIRVPTQAVLGRTTDSLPPEVRNNNPLVDPKKTVILLVFRLVDGKAKMTPVVVGASDNSHTMIKSGLTEVDRIITGPYKILDALTNDQPVKEEAAGATTNPATQASNPTTQSSTTMRS
jgi:HlyD family secretion protein